MFVNFLIAIFAKNQSYGFAIYRIMCNFAVQYH